MSGLRRSCADIPPRSLRPAASTSNACPTGADEPTSVPAFHIVLRWPICEATAARERCLPGPCSAPPETTRSICRVIIRLSGYHPETHQHCSPADATCCQSLLLDPDATISIDLHKRLFLLVSGGGE